MTDFFERIKALSPGLGPKEVSVKLNDFENGIFNKFPWMLEVLNAEQQNDIIVYLYDILKGIPPHARFKIISH